MNAEAIGLPCAQCRAVVSEPRLAGISRFESRFVECPRRFVISPEAHAAERDCVRICFEVPSRHRKTVWDAVLQGFRRAFATAPGAYGSGSRVWKDNSSYC